VFANEELKDYLLTSQTVTSKSVVTAEWNMNIPGNIQKLGNYRYRKDGTLYNILPNYFELVDTANTYTGATDADVTIDSGFVNEDEEPIVFKYPKKKEALYYSLEECIKPFRPRSGINKLSYFNNRYLPNSDKDMFLRPRYYMSTRDDEFKYWRSYRTESANNITQEYGISKNSTSGVYSIDDAVPFVVYKEAVPVNRILVKLQTNVGSVDLGPFRGPNGTAFPDPFFGASNKTVPVNFKVQYLDPNNQWLDAANFTSLSVRDDGESPIFDVDGYLSLEYGLENPYQFGDSFRYLGQLQSSIQLPSINQTLGDGYLIASNAEDRGLLYIWDGSEWLTVLPKYSWVLSNDSTGDGSKFISKLVDPGYYTENETSAKTFREFIMIKGIRLVVDTMNTPNTPLELIEFSSRLVVNMSDITSEFRLTKTLSDLSGAGLPVGQILASTGSIDIFDYDEAFNEFNVWTGGRTGSLISKYLNKNIKFSFYELIENVNDKSYYVPLKSLYSEGIPQNSSDPGKISINLRDLFFHFESLESPHVLLTEVSLSQAVCLLLDSIGFSNYVIRRLPDEKDPIIPYFFIAPNQSVAEVLADLAVATQSAMFFDEYNNFVVMTKNYMLDESVRPVDMVLRGQEQNDIADYSTASPGELSNIIAISSADKKIFNAGTIDYTTRSIERSYGSLQQSLHVDKTWIYKPSLLWEVSGTEKTTTANAQKQEKFALGAMPLNSDLSSLVPSVLNHQIINNIFDVGENAYWITRFKGYLYAGGEIIKYDAVEYSITGTGNVFLSDNLEYQRYFSKLPFNGKIYPTGRIRIYAEPFYETKDGITKLKNGEVVSHGRGQFGTPVTQHKASIDSYWTSISNVQGCNMKSQFLYNIDPSITGPATTVGPAGLNKTKAEKSQRNGIIKNFLSSNYATETDVSNLKSTSSGTIQSSALVFTGPTFNSDEKPQDFLSYVYRPIDKAYKHFGTRLRVIGKIEANGENKQSPVGGMNYFTLENEDPTKTITLGGGSGGISLVDPTTNNGYYFEIAALTSGNLEQFLKKDDEGNPTVGIQNLLFYKIQKDASNNDAIPIKLWGGIANVTVDDGNFTGQYRFTGEDNPTVYDVAIEYIDVNEGTRVFYLYINQRLVKTITDTSPLTFSSPSIGLFVRGTSKLMFENVYALGKNYAQNTVFDTNVPIAAVFGDDNNQINALEALQKYSISGVVQSTYLSGISPSGTPAYQLYYDEFGDILRECAYFNIKYDRAYPALYAQISPTFNRLRGYTVSGFTADSYGAEFLIFNNTDTILNLDETTGNYLRIQGVTFTQDSTNKITVDDYLKRKGNLSDPELKGSTLVESPLVVLEQYDKIKNSRLLYGKNDFSLQSDYIQDQDSAEELLQWIINKNLRPRKSVGMQIFPIPTMQLGDIVNVNYVPRTVQAIATPDTRFVVYNIEYTRNSQGPSMTVHVSEV
jgi:hypothetical protein